MLRMPCLPDTHVLSPAEPPVHKAARGMDEWERHEQQQDTTGSMRMYAGEHPDDSPPHRARTPAAAPNDFHVYQDSPEAGAEVSPEHGVRDQDVTNDVDSRDSWQPGEDDTVLEDVDIELDSSAPLASLLVSAGR